MKNKLFIALLTTLSLLFGAASVSAAGLSAGLSVAYGQAEGSASENVGGQIESEDADGEIIMPSIFVELQLDLGPISPSIGIEWSTIVLIVWSSLYLLLNNSSFFIDLSKVIPNSLGINFAILSTVV